MVGNIFLRTDGTKSNDYTDDRVAGRVRAVRNARIESSGDDNHPYFLALKDEGRDGVAPISKVQTLMVNFAVSQGGREETRSLIFV